MKTLLFTLEYPPFHGGVANYYGNLVKFWPEASAISVLSNNDSRLINEKLPLLKWLPSFPALRQKIRADKIDHVLVGQLLPLGTVAYVCSKFCRIKYSIILHGLDFTAAIKSGRKKIISKIILNGAEKIICANRYLAGLVKETFPNLELKIAVVNPGVEKLAAHLSSEALAKEGNSQSASSAGRLASQLIKKYNLENKTILLSVGRLIKRKGFNKVIEALPEILKQAPNLVYVIIGDGPEFNNYQRQIADGKLENQVTIINQAENEERDAWYQASDIFIMPAKNINGDFEGFGIVYLEANLAGKPVIAGRSGGVGDAVIDGLNGLLVNPEDSNQIASAIIKLAGSPELRNKLGEQGRARALSDFSWKKQVKKIYKSII